MSYSAWMNSILDSMFRSRRVNNALNKFASDNNVFFDKHETSWISPLGMRCVIIDIDMDTDWHVLTYHDVASKITNFVSRRSLTSDEQFYIILADLGKSHDNNLKITKITEDKITMTHNPYIYVYNLHPRIDAQRLLEEFANRTVYLMGGFYGPCRKKFNCYTKSFNMYKEKNQILPNYTPDGHDMSAQNRSRGCDGPSLLYSLLVFDMLCI